MASSALPARLQLHQQKTNLYSARQGTKAWPAARLVAIQPPLPRLRHSALRLHRRAHSREMLRCRRRRDLAPCAQRFERRQQVIVPAARMRGMVRGAVRGGRLRRGGGAGRGVATEQDGDARATRLQCSPVPTCLFMCISILAEHDCDAWATAPRTK